MKRRGGEPSRASPGRPARAHSKAQRGRAGVEDSLGGSRHRLPDGSRGQDQPSSVRSQGKGRQRPAGRGALDQYQWDRAPPVGGRSGLGRRDGAATAGGTGRPPSRGSSPRDLIAKGPETRARPDVWMADRASATAGRRPGTTPRIAALAAPWPPNSPTPNRIPTGAVARSWLTPGATRKPPPPSPRPRAATPTPRDPAWRSLPCCSISSDPRKPAPQRRRPCAWIPATQQDPSPWPWRSTPRATPGRRSVTLARPW